MPYDCDGDNIQTIKVEYKANKANKIAITQVDVLGYSMGGVLARIWAEQKDWVYKRKDNFWQGDYHKLITLDTLHYGSFFADAGVACLSNPVSMTYPDIARAVLLLQLSGHDLGGGAVEDLRTPSANPYGPIAKMNKQKINMLVHSIVGHYTNFTIYYDLFSNRQLGGLPLIYFNIQNILDRHGYSTIPYIINGSDLIVSNDSQQGGLNTAAYLTFWHDHLNAISLEAFNHMVELLNADENSKLFANGYPVTK